MKNLNWLLYIAIIAVTGFLFGFTRYTTDAPLKNWDAAKIAPTQAAGTLEKKPCGCCAKRKALQQKRIQRARARQLGSETATKTSSP